MDEECEHKWFKAGRQICRDGRYQLYRCKLCGKFRKGERVEKFENGEDEW